MNKSIICPLCSAKGTTNLLGSVNENGYLIIKRNAYGTTIVFAQVYQIVCQCGFGTVVQNTSGKAYKPAQISA